MNKNTKRIILMTLAIGIISAVSPAVNVNLLTTKAYASDANDEYYLDSLKLYDDDGNNIKLYEDNDYADRIDDDDVEDGEIYYAKSPSDALSIKIKGPSDKYVKVFSGSSSSSKGKNPRQDVDLSEDTGTTTLIIKVYAEEPDDDIRYKDNDDYDVLSTYRVKVEYTGDDKDVGNNDVYLERLSVNNNMIELSESKTEYTYNVDSDVKEVTIRATPEDDDYDVTIDDKLVYSADNYKTTVDLDEGTNEFEIEIEDGDKDKIYTLIINRGSASSTSTSTTNTKNAEDYDDIYLERLSIDGKVIPLLKSKINYTYSVNSDVNKVIIRAIPEEDNYDVTIDGEYVDFDEDYKKTVHLIKGKNEIEIEIEDNSDKRVYTLVINRGNVSATSTSTTITETTTQNTETDVTNIKTNQWIQVNGKWQYNDISGKPVKDAWVQNYYLQENGNMATGWLNYGGIWYYLGTDGAKKTGWQLIDGSWYYLDSQGEIQTGWFKDIDGKYYYLNNYGAMAYNTTIDGYKLGANGAWIGR